MADPGDRMAARYRELARDEPPAALDAAILAASRRAVGARPGGAARWAGPVSIAAVLVLGLAISLRMQVEQPGIETSATPVERQARQEPPTPKLAIEPSPSQPPSARMATESAAMQSPRAGRAKERAAPPAAPPARSAPSVPSVADNAVAARNAPAPAAVAPTTIDAATAPPPAPAPRSIEMSPGAAPQSAMRAAGPAAEAMHSAAPAADAMRSAPRERREALTQGAAASSVPAPGPEAVAGDGPEAQLERIARLREAKRNEEADRALEEFRRRYPDYRIPAALWERVRSR